MRDFVDLGVTTPSEEDCTQVCSRTYDYYERARREAGALIGQLRRVFGPEPPGALLSIKSHPHDFGDYLTVVCYYDADDPVAAAFAQRCDRECPTTWDDPAHQALSVNPRERR